MVIIELMCYSLLTYFYLDGSHRIVGPFPNLISSSVFTALHGMQKQFCLFVRLSVRRTHA